MKNSAKSIYLDVYGFHLEVKCEDANILDGIHRDFAYFSTDSPASDLLIEIFKTSPSYDSFPNLTAYIYTIDYVSYIDGNITYTDYHGKGLRIYNKCEKRYRIYSDNDDLRYEISYLTVLTSIGKQLDAWHLHRVHALGVSRNGRAILILLPEKGGKTTLALQLLNNDKFKLLSEDSPLLTRKGEILPFPLRIGILPGGETGIPQKYIRPVKFNRVGTKLLVDVDYFSDKISSISKPGIILLGERLLGYESKITPARKIEALKGFMKNSVVGIGLAQGIEYLLGRNMIHSLGNSKLAFSRFHNSLKVLDKSRIYKYSIGHDKEYNTRVLFKFLDEIDL
jgi:hypothetical protein